MKTQVENPEAGFTLVEALVAIVVLVFGLIAVTNLLVVAGTSNSVANQSTAAATEASEVMEALKAIPFSTAAGVLQITPGGNLAADAGSIANCDASTTDCVIPGNYNQVRNIPGVGPIKTRWTIAAVGPAGQPANSALFITVRAEGAGRLVQQRSRAEFTTFRVCASGTPNCP